MMTREEKLRLWCTPQKAGARVGNYRMEPAGSMKLLEAIIGGDRDSHHPPHDRSVGEALVYGTASVFETDEQK